MLLSCVRRNGCLWIAQLGYPTWSFVSSVADLDCSSLVRELTLVDGGITLRRCCFCGHRRYLDSKRRAEGRQIERGALFVPFVGSRVKSERISVCQLSFTDVVQTRGAYQWILACTFVGRSNVFTNPHVCLYACDGQHGCGERITASRETNKRRADAIIVYVIPSRAQNTHGFEGFVCSSKVGLVILVVVACL